MLVDAVVLSDCVEKPGSACREIVPGEAIALTEKLDALGAGVRAEERRVLAEEDRPVDDRSALRVLDGACRGQDGGVAEGVEPRLAPSGLEAAGILGEGDDRGRGPLQPQPTESRHTAAGLGGDPTDAVGRDLGGEPVPGRDDDHLGPIGVTEGSETRLDRTGGVGRGDDDAQRRARRRHSTRSRLRPGPNR
jgi:hypothetical protein